MSRLDDQRTRQAAARQREEHPRDACALLVGVHPQLGVVHLPSQVGVVWVDDDFVGWAVGYESGDYGNISAASVPVAITAPCFSASRACLSLAASTRRS